MTVLSQDETRPSNAGAAPRKPGEPEPRASTRAPISAVEAGLAIAIMLRSCHLQLMDLLRLALRGSDVTNSQYFILRCMLDLPLHRASPSDLSRATGETRSNTTRICEALFQRGWLERIYSDLDRRRVDMSLTQAGKEFTEALIAKVKAYKGATEVFFSLSESAEMARMLLSLDAALARAHSA